MPNGDWLYDLSANRYKKTYMNGFLDISGSLVVRNGSLYLNDGDISLNGHLLVNGDVSLNSNLIVSDTVNTAGNISIVGNTINTNASVEGNTICQNLRVNNDVSFNSKMFVSDDMYINSKLFAVGNVTLNSKLYVGGNVSINSKLTVNDNVYVNNKLIVSGDASFNSKLTVVKDASFNSKLTVGGMVSFNSRLVVNGDVSLNSRLYVTGNVQFNTNISVGNTMINNGVTRILGKMGIGTSTPSVSIDISASDAIRIPVGTTEQRPNASSETNNGGYLRYNTSKNIFEGFGNNWYALGGISNINQNAKMVATTNDLQCYTAPSSSTTSSDAVECMRITSNGDLSINFRVSVGGNVNINGNLNITNHNGSTSGLRLNGSLVKATAQQINRLNVTPGSASIGNAAVVDSNTSISGINNLKITGNLTVGNLIINGSTTTIKTNQLSIADKFIELATDTTINGDSGFIITRASGNQFIGWNSSTSKFTFGSTSNTASSSSVSVTPGILNANLDGSLNATTDNSNTYRNLYFADKTSGLSSIYANTNLKYNPSTGDLSATFVGNLSGTSQTSTNATISTNSDNSNKYVTVTNAIANNSVVYKSGLLYNPSTNTLTATSLSGGVITGLQSSITSIPNLNTIGTITTGTWSATGISSEYILDNTVTSTKFANSSITTVKIADGAITSSKIVTGTIQNSKIGINVLTNSNLTGSITNDKLVSSSFTIGTTNVALGSTINNISGLTTIGTNDLSGNIYGNINGTILNGNQTSITQLTGLISFGTTDISSSIFGNITCASDLSVSGNFTQLDTSNNIITGNVTFSNKPTCTDSSTNNPNQFVTVGYVNLALPGGSIDTTNLVTTNTTQDISGEKLFSATPYQLIDVNYNDNSYNNVNGYFAMAKDVHQQYPDGLSLNAVGTKYGRSKTIPIAEIGMPGGAPWKVFAYSPQLNIFVTGNTASATNMAYSTDGGISWTFNNGIVYVIGGTQSSPTYTITGAHSFGVNVLEWIPPHSNISTLTNFRGLNLSNGYFIGLSYNAGSYVLLSVDGKNWYMTTSGGSAWTPMNMIYIAEINMMLTCAAQPQSLVYTTNTNNPYGWSTSPHAYNTQIVFEGTSTYTRGPWWTGIAYSYVNSVLKVVLVSNSGGSYSAVSTNVSTTNAGTFIAYQKFYTAPSTLYTSGGWTSVDWSPSLNGGNGLFVAVASSTIARSTDGITWDVSLNVLPSGGGRYIKWISSLSIFVVGSGDNTLLHSSSNAITWTTYNFTNTSTFTLNPNSLLSTSSGSVSNFAYAPDISSGSFVFIANVSNSSVNSIRSNNIFSQWTINGNVMKAYNYMLNDNYTCIGYSSYLGITVIIGGTTSKILYSYDHINWDFGTLQTGTGAETGTGTNYLPSNSSWERMCWSPRLKMFVAIQSFYNETAYSYNGVNWVRGGNLPIANPTNLFWSNEHRLFIITRTTTIIQSTNGTTWSNAISSIPTSVVINGTTYTNANTSTSATAYSPDLKMFASVFAVNGNLCVAYSYNLTNWTSVPVYVYFNGANVLWNQSSYPALGNTPDTIYWSRELKCFVGIPYLPSTILVSQNGRDWYGISMILFPSVRTIRMSGRFNFYSIRFDYADTLGLLVGNDTISQKSVITTKMFYSNFERILFVSDTTDIAYALRTVWCDHLDVFVAGNNGSTYIQISKPPPSISMRLQQNTSNYWSILPYTSTTVLLDFKYNANLSSSTTSGYISSTVNTSKINFTGQHRCFVKNKPYSEASSLCGLIVSANTNTYISMYPVVNIGMNAITINESLPVVSISNKDNDKSCFGVISKSEDPSMRSDNYGRFVTILNKELGDTRYYINSVGEGAIWVTNKNGNLFSGDLITTSTIPGYGQKQSSNYFTNYTVAKITMDCNFNPNTQFVQRIKRSGDIVYSYTPAHNYPTDALPEYLKLSDMLNGINKTLSDNSYNEIPDNWKPYFLMSSYFDQDKQSNTWSFTPRFEPTISINETDYNNLDDIEKLNYRRINGIYNVLDDYNQIQFEDTEETEVAYNIRYLMPDSSIINKETYTTLLINNEDVYIAAFVSCTYHCG